MSEAGVFLLARQTTRRSGWLEPVRMDRGKEVSGRGRADCGGSCMSFTLSGMGNRKHLEMMGSSMLLKDHSVLLRKD